MRGIMLVLTYLNMRKKFKMQAKVWLYPGETGAWYLVTLPKNISKEIRAVFGVLERGWRSLPVVAEIGKTRWKTSIFYDNKLGAYIFPLKAEVRKKENISEGIKINFSIEIQT